VVLQGVPSIYVFVIDQKPAAVELGRRLYFQQAVSSDEVLNCCGCTPAIGQGESLVLLEYACKRSSFAGSSCSADITLILNIGPQRSFKETA